MGFKFPFLYDFGFFTFALRGAAQRFALVVVGRAGIMPESRKNPKPEKCLSKPQNPHHPLHAVFGGSLPSRLAN
jgi:hypothetical protein